MDNPAQNQNPVIPPIPDENGGFPASGGFGGPPPTAPVVGTTAPTGGTKSRSTGKIVATIFGLLLLVGGIGAGIILVNQQQTLKEKAATPPTCSGTISCKVKANPSNILTVDCATKTDETTCTQQNTSPGGLDPNSLTECTGSCVWSTPSSTGGGTSSGTFCSGNCCQLGANPNNYLVKQCTCTSHTASPCNDNCVFGGSVCANPQCGTVQLDIVNQAHQEASVPGQTQVLIHAATDCTGGGGTSGGANCDGTCSNYCAGPDQCASQGGHDVGRGCTGGVATCGQNQIHCFIPAACQNFGGGGGGTAPAPKACGETCTTDSECKTPSANGSTVKCVNGTCQNTSCVGKTIPGANCDCSSLNACGQGCSATVGLCQTGSTCRYIVGPSCTADPNPSFPTTTFCVPNPVPAGWTEPKCVARDQGNAYVLNSSGQNPTLAEIQQACAPAPTAQCSNVGSYDTNWNPLTVAELSALKPGDKVRFTVTGTTSSGAFDQARFTINGAQQTPVTGKRPNSADFFEEYTIPAGVTNFTVTAQIHLPSNDTWY